MGSIKERHRSTNGISEKCLHAECSRIEPVITKFDLKILCLGTGHDVRRRIGRDTYIRHTYEPHRMAVIQNLIGCTRPALFALLAAALWLNSLAPMGYMIAPSENGWLTVTVCPETHPLAAATNSANLVLAHHTAIDHAAMGHVADDDDQSPRGQSKECAFAGLTDGKAAVSTALLLLALAFALLLGLAPRAPVRLTSRLRDRPPSRGPPSFA